MKAPLARPLGQRSEDVVEGRVRLLAAVMILVFGAFGLRLFQLQIVEGEILRQKSQKNSIRWQHLEAPRGRIVDREGRVLATTRPAFGLGVVPSDLRDRDHTFRVLASLVEGEALRFRERVTKAGRGRRHRLLRLEEDLSFEELARVEVHRHALPGVVTDVRPRRHYLEGELAAHLLGSIGEIGQAELEGPGFAGYRAGDVIGKSGLEARLERHLRGRAGRRTVVVDVAGREVERVGEAAPVAGGTAVLALDLDLQRAAEEAFREVEEGKPARVGAAVALDVRNGDVLAVVARPAFDPNSFAGGIDRETWQQLTSDPWKPLQNRAVQNRYPPGSTYKPLVAAALLEEGVVTPKTRVFCPGYYRFGRRNYRCWKRVGHGWVDLREALKSSCDVYFYQHGVKLGIDRLAHYAKAFGLGQRTGIAMSNEARGLVPSSEWKEKRFKQPWFPGETVSASIGQGFNLTTPVQLAVAYAALANGGKVLRPRLLLRLESEGGSLIEEFEAEQRGNLPVAPEWLEAVREGLTAVVEEAGGTGGRSRVPGVRVAGKTGTVQVVRLEQTEGLEDDEIPMRHRDHAWFAAFAPAETAEIAVAVFVEHGQHGSSSAAPIAQRVLATYFDKQKRRKQQPVEPLPGDLREEDPPQLEAEGGLAPGSPPGAAPSPSAGRLARRSPHAGD